MASVQALCILPLAAKRYWLLQVRLLTIPVPAGLQRDISDTLLLGCFEAGSAATPGFFLRFSRAGGQT